MSAETDSQFIADAAHRLAMSRAQLAEATCRCKRSIDYYFDGRRGMPPTVKKRLLRLILEQETDGEGWSE